MTEELVFYLINLCPVISLGMSSPIICNTVGATSASEALCVGERNFNPLP